MLPSITVDNLNDIKVYNANNMKKLFYRNARGFTLIELLVVITIIGVLATLLLFNLGTARSKTRDAQRATQINQIELAVESYFEENGAYPPDIADATIGKFMRNGKVPKDPLTAASYGYGADGSPRVKYQIWAEFEVKVNALNNDADLPGNTFTSPAGVNGATEACTSAANDCIFDLGSL